MPHYTGGGGGGGVTDHGGLTGLADDDHPQYHNDARGDARYATTAQGAKADTALQPGADYDGLSNKPALGSAAPLDAGTAANNVVKLDEAGKLPGVDGSGLTGLPTVITDHGGMSGLGDDDHLQYHNHARGDARYIKLADILNEHDMASNSATGVVSQQSVKAFVMAVASGLLRYEGGYNAATNTPNLDTSPVDILTGHTYAVSTAGSFFGGVDVEAGDLLIAEQDDPTTVDHWTIVNKNIAALALVAVTGQWADLLGKPSLQSLTYAAAIAPDASLHKDFIVPLLTGDVTVNKPTGASPAATVAITLVQDATGNRLLTLGTGVNWHSSVGDRTLSTEGNEKDVLLMMLDPSEETTNWTVVGLQKGMF